jgi:hypothetical protein
MPGSSRIQKGNWSIPADNKTDYVNMGWQYYEVPSPVADMASYYRKQMAARDWNEKSWNDTPQMSWGLFTKNNENDAAMVWISTGETGKTVIALWRAAK